MISGGYMEETKVYNIDEFQDAYILSEVKNVTSTSW